jgi:sugar/nucleoside kinase (ribokinase family)
MTRVLVVGDIVTDVLAVLEAPIATGSDAPARVRFTGGGAAANTAVWLAQAGVPVTLLAAVGDDTAADARLAELAAAGVELAVRRCAGAATGTVVVLAERDERSMLFDRGANLLLAPSDVDAALGGTALSGAAAHLHLSGYTLLDERPRPAGRHALAAARAAGMTTSVDASSAEPLRHAPEFLDWVRDVDVLFANEDEAAVLAASDAEPAAPAATLAAALVAAGVAAVVVKCGAAGAVWADSSGRRCAVPAEATTVIDPTGAGDAFAAGFLSAWLATGDPESGLRAGAGAGARAVSMIGARPAP